MTIMGSLGRATIKTGEVIGVGAIELPKLVLVGTGYAGAGIEAVGRAVKDNSRAGVVHLTNMQEALEAKTSALCEEITAKEVEANIRRVSPDFDIPAGPAESVPVEEPQPSAETTEAVEPEIMDPEPNAPATA